MINRGTNFIDMLRLLFVENSISITLQSFYYLFNKVVILVSQKMIYFVKSAADIFTESSKAWDPREWETFGDLSFVLGTIEYVVIVWVGL